MNATKRFIAGGVISASMLTGGVIGAIGDAGRADSGRTRDTGSGRQIL